MICLLDSFIDQEAKKANKIIVKFSGFCHGSNGFETKSIIYLQALILHCFDSALHRLF